jgi:hypothetical protein
LQDIEHTVERRLVIGGVSGIEPFVRKRRAPQPGFELRRRAAKSLDLATHGFD